MLKKHEICTLPNKIRMWVMKETLKESGAESMGELHNSKDGNRSIT